MVKIKSIKPLFLETVNGWSDDKALKLAAALAYYTVFSLAPLLLIFIGIASVVFKGDAARGQVVHQIGGLIGTQAAEAIQTMIVNAGQSGHGIVATVVGLATMFLGASGVFGELQDSMNMIWKVDQKKHSGIKAFVKDRFFSFTMVVGVGFLLTVSLMLSAAVGAVTQMFGGTENGMGFFWESINFLVSFGVTTVLFTLIFKVIPDVKLSWRDTWLGGFLTAILFTIGKTLLGIYVGKSGVASSYGAAGSLVLVLLWVYYTAQILFLGAEFTRVYATTHGSLVQTGNTESKRL